MIFGISVSDIYGCARLAYILYNEFKQAPGACRDFASNLLLFHQVLLKTKSTIECEASHLSDSDNAALMICLDSCKELLYVQTAGAHMKPLSLEGIDFNTHNLQIDFRSRFEYDQSRFLRGLRQKLGERKFALQIPKLERAITAHIEQLTAFNVLIIQSHQSGIRDSQERIKEYVEESHDLLVKSSTDHTLQLESVSDRLETSQARIESQLQAILANQQKSRTPIISQSLDASSPEGRETWMELGRLLRDEGITPAMIQENREVLICAMKSTLRNETLAAESIPQSYTTAPESHADNSSPSSVTQPRYFSPVDPPPALSPLSLLGSAPPRDSGFTDAFFERKNGVARSLDEKQNVDDGMQSLLQGMSCDETSGVYRRDDKDSEEEDFEFEGGPMHCSRPSAIYRRDDIEDSEVEDSELPKPRMNFEVHRMHGITEQRSYSDEPSAQSLVPEQGPSFPRMEDNYMID